MKMEHKLALLRSAEGAEPVQFGALCTRRKAGAVEVLLITSRDTGRWVVPKGWAMPGRSGAEAAVIEAWEEAGVVGALGGPSTGSFVYQKMLGIGLSMPCRVQLYPVRVERLAADWPEKGQRRRKWFRVQKAAKLVREPELAALLRALAR